MRLEHVSPLEYYVMGPLRRLLQRPGCARALIAPSDVLASALASKALAGDMDLDYQSPLQGGHYKTATWTPAEGVSVKFKFELTIGDPPYYALSLTVDNAVVPLSASAKQELGRAIYLSRQYTRERKEAQRAADAELLACRAIERVLGVAVHTQTLGPQ